MVDEGFFAECRSARDGHFERVCIGVSSPPSTPFLYGRLTFDNGVHSPLQLISKNGPICFQKIAVPEPTRYGGVAFNILNSKKKGVAC